jgi:hypothetical protein
MPLPEQLKKGAPKKKKEAVVKATMHDLKHGPHHKDRTHKQEVAIAMKQSGQSKKKADSKFVAKFQKKSNKDAHRRKRNIGRS